MTFPSLVGGTLVHKDLAPSIVFAISYGFIVLLAIFRLLWKSSRTTLLIGTATFSIERVVIFSLRAVQSTNQAKAKSPGLATYEQLTIGMGYIGICQGLIGFLRVLLVNSTRPVEREGSKEPGVDHPRERYWYRRLSEFLSLAFFAAIAPGIISGSRYSQGIDDDNVAKLIMNLRYASTGVALFLTAIICAIAFIAPLKNSRIDLRPARILMSLAAILSVVGIYRLSVMHNTTDSLLSRGPGSLSSPSAKALFYIFHITPEWLASILLLRLNARKVFKTGPFGDWRGSDKETPWERKRREKKEREIAESGGDDQGVAKEHIPNV